MELKSKLAALVPSLVLYIGGIRLARNKATFDEVPVK